MLTAAAGCAGLEAEPCSRGALRSGLSWSACLLACLIADACSRTRLEGEGSVFIRMCQAGRQEWTVGHNGAPRHVSIKLLILLRQTRRTIAGQELRYMNARPDTVWM